jgi:hypothetical protein
MIDLRLERRELRLRLRGAERLLARRSELVLPRRRIQKAFVLGRRFAMGACPRFPVIGWSTSRSRVGTFGYGDDCQLWSVQSRAVILAIYLRGQPFHRIVLEVDDPVRLAADINRWVRRAN